MSPKLQKVCNYYLQGMSMREALIKAGYSDAYASHMSSKFLHNRECQRYIRARQKDEADAAMVDRIYLLKNLQRIIDRPGVEERDKNAALKIMNEYISKQDEIKAKIDVAEKQLDAAPKESQINITFKDA
jgi:phage terminase small subunit